VSDNANYEAILLFGCPGSGKGTQGLALAGLPNLYHLAMGDIFRGLDKQSDIGKEFLSYSTQGLLVPDELTVRVWKQHVQGLIDSGELRPDYHVLLLDGIPRTPTQVELLRDCLNVLRVIHLVIENVDALVTRLSLRARKANRPDDADPAVIRKRIDVYEQETAPVLRAFNTGLVTEINADQHPLAVLRDIADCLSQYVSGAI
jgi:adenylate kinase